MKHVTLFLVMLFICVTVFGQTIFKGVVLNEKSVGIAGATIFSAESVILETTDTAGNFSIDASHIQKGIRVQYQGYQTLDTLIHNITELGIIPLKPLAREIEEVIVSTGYQRIPRERATGSFDFLNEELLNRRVTSTVLEKLEYLAPGLQFDNRSGNAKINVRGINTFSAALTDPLIVVDNFPYEGDIGNIDPNEVESVTILKDAAAASIWGAKAGNGVIVITMKRSSATERRSLSAVANTTIGEKPDLFYQPAMNSSDFIDVEMFLYDNGHYRSALANRNNRTTVFSPVITLLDQLDKGLFSEEQAMDRINSFRDMDYRHEMLQRFYRPSIDNQFNVSLATGNNAFSSRMAVAYQRSRHAEMGAHDDRFNLRVATDYRPIDKLVLRTTAMVTMTGSTNSAGFPTYPINPGGGKTRMYPYAQLFDENGNALAVPYQLNTIFVDTVGGGQLLDWKYKPYNEIAASQIRGASQHMLLGAEVNYKLAKDLAVNVNYNYERQVGTSETQFTMDSFYARNLINRFTQVNNGIPTYSIPKGEILRHMTQALSSHKIRGQVNYNTAFSEKHSVDALLGAEISNRMNNGIANGIYGYSPEKQISQTVDYITAFPIYAGLTGNSRIPSNENTSKLVNRFVSMYFNGSYSYRQRYIASFSARRDASNIFGVNTNRRWNPLWSAGAAWIMNKEEWLNDAPWIDNLKLAVTYGHSGNAGGVASLLPVLSYLARSGTWTTDLPRAFVESLPNADLKWENVQQTNFALHYSFFKGALAGSVEYYRKRSTDLLSPDLIDPTHGFTTTTRNIGTINTKGVDVQVGSRGQIKNLRWNGQLLFSWNKNNVEEYYGTILTSPSYATNAGRALNPITDKPLYPVHAYQFAGLDPENGDPQGMLTGEISKNYSRLLNEELDQLVYFGTALPPVHGALRNSLGYGNWDFSFNIAFKYGHYFQRETIHYTSLFNSWTSHADYALRWQNPGDEERTSVPSMAYPANTSRDRFFAYSEANIDRGDVIRLQDVQLSHTFSFGKPRLNRKMKVYANIFNLGVLWKATTSHIDPDYSFLPPGRRYTIGTSVNF